VRTNQDGAAAGASTFTQLKGVVTYHFAAKDDLIFAVAEHIIDSMAEFLDPGGEDVEPEAFVAAYITA
jgi:AcrR family transcriptional regulator